jgi:hypothetical protein
MTDNLMVVRLFLVLSHGGFVSDVDTISTRCAPT